MKKKIVVLKEKMKLDEIKVNKVKNLYEKLLNI